MKKNDLLVLGALMAVSVIFGDGIKKLEELLRLEWGVEAV